MLEGAIGGVPGVTRTCGSQPPTFRVLL